jgi:hypothetical protein
LPNFSAIAKPIFINWPFIQIKLEDILNAALRLVFAFFCAFLSFSLWTITAHSCIEKAFLHAFWYVLAQVFAYHSRSLYTLTSPGNILAATHALSFHLTPFGQTWAIFAYFEYIIAVFAFCLAFFLASVKA